MFWPLFLAHLLADYPLQSDWMVQAKKTWPGLATHVAVHLATVLIVLNGFLRFEWHATLPAILAVAGTDKQRGAICHRYALAPLCLWVYSRHPCLVCH